ncbi:unnamed protein product [Durusdinium trenchii]|uniref:Uncharacterized protein n=1 Tax=Durusdinium trenchii TaxID=1381693 RepID=A0ABP0I278_9DINO
MAGFPLRAASPMWTSHRLEVWARLLASTPCIPCAELDQAAEQLCCACASDAYARVRRRGLLVLLQCSALHPQSMTKHLEKIRRVLEKACFADADCQQACVQIAEHLDLDSNGLQGLGPSHEADTIPAGQD